MALLRVASSIVVIAVLGIPQHRLVSAYSCIGIIIIVE